MNGKPNSTMLFGNLELHLYLDETSLAVDERRHGDVMHMPQAILNLQEVIAGQLKEKYAPPVPLQDWIQLQFWPTINVYTEQALRYTSQFNVKFGVQIRQITQIVIT